MKKSVSILISVSMLAALFLAACTKSEPRTVESIVNSDETIANTIETAASGNGVSVDIKENTITYSYDISNVEGVTDEMAENDDFVGSIESSLDSLSDTMVNVAATVEEQTGIEGVVVNVSYTYKGKELASASFTSTGKVEDASDNKENA